MKIDGHNGVTRVTDPTFERKLPFDIPLREPILEAAMKNGVDPAYLAAIGVQETHLGADYLGATTAHYKSTHRGDVEDDSVGGHGYGPFQKDDQKRFGQSGLPQSELDRIARDPYYAADVAAKDLAQNIKAADGNLTEAFHLYNAGTLTQRSSTTDWGPTERNVPYEDSTMRYLHQVQNTAAREAPTLGHSR